MDFEIWLLKRFLEYIFEDIDSKRRCSIRLPVSLKARAVHLWAKRSKRVCLQMWCRRVFVWSCPQPSQQGMRSQLSSADLKVENTQNTEELLRYWKGRWLSWGFVIQLSKHDFPQNLLLTNICTSFCAYCPEGADTLQEYTPASAGSAGHSSSSPPLPDSALPVEPTSSPPRCQRMSLQGGNLSSLNFLMLM